MGDSNRKEALLVRLDEIAAALARHEGALALLALGSVGRELERLDRYSDLDFFVIVEADHKERFISDLAWLSEVAPLTFSFQNTVDGHKALFSDGIFCEFAVFGVSELPGIPFEEGRLVWKRDKLDTALLAPGRQDRHFGAADEAFLLGELLTNLYVGLGRFARGERLSACFFVQHHAVVRLIELLELWGEAQGDFKDSFSNERRFERRCPQHAELIESVTPGYRHTPAAAERMLDFVAGHVALNEQMTAEIRRLIAAARPV